MRRRILALVVLATLLVPVASVAADTTGGGGTSFHFSESGKGADAGWSTSPFDGPVVADVVYTDTFLSTAEQATRADGTVYADKFVYVDQTSYKYDRSGNWIFVSETSGFAGGSDVALSVNAKLSSASVTATVSLQTCTAGRRGSVTCVDGTGSVSAAWTGVGDTIKSSGTFHVVSKGFTETSKSRQTFRNATTRGSVNGADLGEQQFYGEIFSAASRDIFICHGPGPC
jgi:hypothetical protein